jgi:hypothetical protein
MYQPTFHAPGISIDNVRLAQASMFINEIINVNAKEHETPATALQAYSADLNLTNNPIEMSIEAQSPNLRIPQNMVSS